MNRRTFRTISALFLFLFFVAASLPMQAQTITATLEGRVLDPSGAVLPGATVTAVNAGTGISRSVVSSEVGEYRIVLLPPGEYEVSIELSGFRQEVHKFTLQVGQVATLDFSLQIGELAQEVVVEASGALLEPTRTAITSVIVTKQIETLPISGRQFIDFALLAPGITIGETTAGSTDVIVEPVTKLSFAGQNIHYNFVAVDGADNISTASGIHKTTPSQEAVQEFRVINTQYGAEFGRAVGGIVNIITKSGSNDLHGSVYEFFRNDALDARSILATPGLDKLQQNQFGFTLGGPVAKDRTFFFANYEGQRRRESPFYNSALFANIDTINTAKVSFGLPAENLNVTRTANADTGLFKLDHALSNVHSLSGRYFFTDGRFTNQSPLNDGFDAPSTFRDNFFNDQSAVVNLTSAFSPTFLNEFRGQYARRIFDFPSKSTEPHLEVNNIFTTGVNRGNPENYKEWRIELVDQVSLIRGEHTLSFGGNFNFVRTRETFLLFDPFEATFASVNDYLIGNPFVIFWEKFDPAATGLNTSFFLQGGFPQAELDRGTAEVDHTYNGFFIQDKWRATSNLTLNFGVRYEWETWPNRFIDNDLNNVDPRFGFAYNVGGKANLVIRGGAGLFHGTIPSPLLMCQEPVCGGSGPFPGREQIQNEVNSNGLLFAFASAPPVMQATFNEFITNGTFPVAGPFDFLKESTIVRFARDHQAPYGIQMSLGFGFEPARDVLVNISYLRVKGINLGSFFNVNQPDPTEVLASGKDGFCTPGFRFGSACFLPGTRDPNFAIFFEADSRWRSVYDGLLVQADKRFSRHLGFGISYTWSKTIDDGPNPSFVLIPENSQRFDLERAVSSDHVGHRFVGNTTIAGPTDVNPVVNDFQFSFIVSLQSARFFTKFAGFDANGDVFGVNDRVGLEGRNTFKGDTLKSVDARVSRTFHLGEKVEAEIIAEAFNVFNTLNVRLFNTVYGDWIFNPPGTPGTFLDGARNPSFGTPRAISNPRQIQFALRLTF